MNFLLALSHNFYLDYMHLCSLGVTRKIFRILTKPKKGLARNQKLNCGTISSMAMALIKMQAYIPHEFVRKTQSSSFGGKPHSCVYVVLQYGCRAYMKISCCFVQPSLCFPYCQYAESLLLAFVQNFAEIYGVDSLSYNVHSVIHLADDVRKYGNLDNVSSFPFDNFLGTLKKIIRKPNMVLQQAVRGIFEHRSNLYIIC